MAGEEYGFTMAGYGSGCGNWDMSHAGVAVSCEGFGVGPIDNLNRSEEGREYGIIIAEQGNDIMIWTTR